MQQTQATIRPKDEILAKLDSPDANTVPKKCRRMKKNAQKFKIAQNYRNFKLSIDKLRKIRRPREKHSYTIKVSPLSEEETDSHITERCPDSLKEMQKKLRERSNNLDKLMQKHRRINSIYCKSYKSRKGTLYLNDVSPKNERKKARSSRNTLIKKRKKCQLKKNRSGSKTPKVAIPLQLNQNLKRTSNGGKFRTNSCLTLFRKSVKSELKYFEFQKSQSIPEEVWKFCQYEQDSSD